MGRDPGSSEVNALKRRDVVLSTHGTLTRSHLLYINTLTPAPGMLTGPLALGPGDRIKSGVPSWADQLGSCGRILAVSLTIKKRLIAH
ncbi:hypothetical protein VNO77_46349 [Canavalia gladiata]|uniref:Uncharacterized protein n=1 Tax=Canavalia gladiata TaxID=3824 RepID=A0AAN9PGV4_CANGL